jgi:hypothetical protein
VSSINTPQVWQLEVPGLGTFRYLGLVLTVHWNAPWSVERKLRNTMLISAICVIADIPLCGTIKLRLNPSIWVNVRVSGSSVAIPKYVCDDDVHTAYVDENTCWPTKSMECRLAEKLIVPHLVKKIVRMLWNSVFTRSHAGSRDEPAVPSPHSFNTQHSFHYYLSDVNVCQTVLSFASSHQKPRLHLFCSHLIWQGSQSSLCSCL